MDDERPESLHCPSFPITILQMQKYFPSVLTNRVYLLKENLQSLKKHNMTEFQTEYHLFALEEQVGRKEEIFRYPKKKLNLIQNTS